MLETFETVAKAIADPNRVRILKLLEGGELCVCQITTVLNLAAGTISKHLGVLEAAGYVEVVKGFVGKRPRTWLALTPAGRAAFESYAAVLPA